MNDEKTVVVRRGTRARGLGTVVLFAFLVATVGALVVSFKAQQKQKADDTAVIAQLREEAHEQHRVLVDALERAAAQVIALQHQVVELREAVNVLEARTPLLSADAARFPLPPSPLYKTTKALLGDLKR